MEGKCLGVFGLSLYTTAEELETVSKKIQSKFKRFFFLSELGSTKKLNLVLREDSECYPFLCFSD